MLKKFINEILLEELEKTNRFEEDVHYFINDIQKVYPVSLVTMSQLSAFLKEAIPVMVLTGLYRCNSLKVCSGVSPDFTEVACSQGFPTLTISAPGHFYNAVITKDGIILVDLSYIQFSRTTHWDDEEGREEVDTLLKKVLHNPFSAVKIENLGKNTSILFRGSLPQGENVYSNSWNPVEKFGRAKQQIAKILSDRETYRKGIGHEIYRDADFGINMDPSVLDALK